jgi:hypothetical protein
LIRGRFRRCGAPVLAAAVLTLGCAATARAQEQERVLVDVYGLSYHTNRNRVHAEQLDNEFNPGLGLRYEFSEDARRVKFLEAGFYKDSGRHWTAFAGPGYQFKLGERWRAGAELLFFDSRTYNHGRPFVAPIPLVTYDLGSFRLNAVYAPRVSDINEFAVFGFYLSVPLR